MKKFIKNEEIQVKFAAQVASGKVFIAEKIESISKAGEKCVDIVLAQGTNNALNDFARKNLRGAIKRIVAFSIPAHAPLYDKPEGFLIEGRNLVNRQFTAQWIDTADVTQVSKSAFDADGKLRSAIPLNQGEFFAATAEGNPIYNEVVYTADMNRKDSKIWDGVSKITKSEMANLMLTTTLASIAQSANTGAKENAASELEKL